MEKNKNIMERKKMNEDYLDEERGMGFFGWSVVLAVIYIIAPFIWVWDFVKGEGRK